MNKSDLIKAILNKNNKYKISEIENIVDLFFREIREALTQGKRIEIRGFGSFFTKTRENLNYRYENIKVFTIEQYE